MKILIIEDKAIHVEAAKRTLAGHDLTIATTADEGLDALITHVDYEKSNVLRVQYAIEAGFPADVRFWGDDRFDAGGNAKLREIEKRAEKEATPTLAFDAVLTDMMLPGSGREMGGDGSRHVGVEAPYGYNFIFRAAHQGVKLIGMLTEGNHHHHPMSAALDGFPLEQPFTLNGSVVVISRELSQQFKVEGEQCKDCAGSGKKDGHNCYTCGGDGVKTFRGKDWGALLSYLTGEKGPQD